MREYTKSNHLQHKIIKYTWLSRLSSAGTAVFFVSALYGLTISYVVSAVSAILFWGSWSLKKGSDRNRDIYAAGFEGEQRLKFSLQNILSNEYTTFFNIDVRGIGEIDSLVVGPSGLYLFEAKNNSGEITYDDDGWWRIKGRGRSIKAERLKSPSNQVLGTLHRLKKFLSKNGIDVWIEGVVVFTNPNASLTLVKELKGVKVITIQQIESVFVDGYNLALKDGRRIESLLKGI